MHVWFRGGLIFVDFRVCGSMESLVGRKRSPDVYHSKLELCTRIARYEQSDVCFGLDQWRLNMSV